MTTITLINRHGRAVDVDSSRRGELLDRGYRMPAGEEVPAQEGTSEGDGSQGELAAVSSLKKSEWLEMADGLGVDAHDGMTKSEIREAIDSA